MNSKIEEEEKKEVPYVEEQMPSSDEDLEALKPEDWVYMVQRETFSENIERALRLNNYEWNIDDFIYHEKHVDGVYSYIDKFYDDDHENLKKSYEACILFCKQGHLPKEIQSKTLKYFWAFGEKSFFESDVQKLSNFATSIEILDFKLRHN